MSELKRVIEEMRNLAEWRFESREDASHDTALLNFADRLKAIEQSLAPRTFTDEEIRKVIEASRYTDSIFEAEQNVLSELESLNLTPPTITAPEISDAICLHIANVAFDATRTQDSERTARLIRNMRAALTQYVATAPTLPAEPSDAWIEAMGEAYENERAVQRTFGRIEFLERIRAAYAALRAQINGEKG